MVGMFVVEIFHKKPLSNILNVLYHILYKYKHIISRYINNVISVTKTTI